MRLLVTLVLALVLSWLGGSVVAMLVANWAQGDESFILAFMAIPLAGLVVAVIFLVAATRPAPAPAINVVTLVMVALLALLFAALSVFEFFVNGTLASAWRGVQLSVGIFGGCAAVLIVQWLVFRWRTRTAPPAMMFGRGPGAPA